MRCSRPGYAAAKSVLKTRSVAPHIPAGCIAVVRLERTSVMYRQVILCIFWLLSCEIASAEVLKNGQSVRDATNAMKAGGYERTILEMGPRGKGQGIHFWRVGQGTLTVEHSKATDEVAGLRFLLQDERRPKGDRQMYVFDVVAFDTDTGEMTIRTRKSNPPAEPDRRGN
jgi:hypothetical protein